MRRQGLHGDPARAGAPDTLALWAWAPETISPGMATLTFTLNGDFRELSAPISVAGLLERVGLDRRKVAVERNEEIVPRGLYETTWLCAGDAIEIVHFIGGG